MGEGEGVQLDVWRSRVVVDFEDCRYEAVKLDVDI